MSASNYEHLDDWDLKNEYHNLIEGMKTFTEETKLKYSEAWKNRCERKRALETELNNRNITF